MAPKKWVKQAGGSDSDRGNAITTLDKDGSTIVTGSFSASEKKLLGTASFGDTILTTKWGVNNAFVAKLDSNGEYVWAKKPVAAVTMKEKPLPP